MEMSQDDQITVRGYVTGEPKLYQRTPEQLPLATIRVGSTPRRLNRETGEWQDGEPSYYTVKCWRRLAENVHGSLRKGDMVIVRGKVITRSWLDDQQRVRTEMQIEADTVGHDLAFGWSRFNRGLHTPPGVQRGLDQGEAARNDVTLDPDLPDDARFGDARFGDEGDDAEPVYDDGDPEGAGRPDGPDEPRSADDEAFAELAKDLSQPADAGAPY
jgi:single-strand DNA-binding protein